MSNHTDSDIRSILEELVAASPPAPSFDSLRSRRHAVVHPIREPRRRGVVMVGAISIASSLIAAIVVAAVLSQRRGGDVQIKAPSSIATPPTSVIPLPPTTSLVPPSTSVVPSGWKVCENIVKGYSMSYPGDWWAFTQDAPLGPPDTAPAGSYNCRIFNPTPLEVKPFSEFPWTGLEIWECRNFECGLLDSPRFYDVLASESAQVGGHQAIRFEVKATGAGMGPAGLRIYGYVIDTAPGRYLVVQTHEGLEGRLRLEYEDNKKVVDQAARTLKTIGPPATPTPSPPATAPTSTSPSPTTGPNSVQVYNLTLHLPAQWQIGGVSSVRSIQAYDPGPSSGTGCAGGKACFPYDDVAAVLFGYTLGIDDLSPTKCFRNGKPPDSPVTLVGSGLRPIGDRKAEWREWSITCQGVTEIHDAWLLPLSRVAFYENCHDKRVEDVVATTEVSDRTESALTSGRKEVDSLHGVGGTCPSS
jgi:hypothetical protein